MLAAAPITGCGGDDFTGETIAVDVASGKADDLTEIRVRAPGLTLWMRPLAERRQSTDGQVFWVFRGRVSKNLESVQSFISEREADPRRQPGAADSSGATIDDAFGQASITGKRTFEVAFDGGHEINSLESGLRLFVSIDVVNSDADYTASFLTGPSLGRFAGDGSVFLFSPVRPVYDGGLIYRGRAETKLGGALSASNPAGPPPAIAPRGPKQWDIDFEFAALAAGADASVDFAYTAAPGGSTTHKLAGVDFALTELGITVEDPASEWPPADGCDASVQACIDGLPAGSVDTEPCGAYREVVSCNLPGVLPELGTAPDDNTALQTVIADASAQLPDGKKIEFENLYVQSTGTATPTLAQVMDAYTLFTNLEGLENLGEGDQAEVAGGLKNFHATGGIDAAREVVFDDDFVVGKMFHVSEPAPSALQWVTYYLLYFPDAGRLVIFHLVTFET